MVGTTVFAFTVGMVLVSILIQFGVPEPEGWLGALALAVAWISISGLIDLKIFAWGVDYFELVPPWQFRVGEDVGGKSP